MAALSNWALVDIVTVIGAGTQIESIVNFQKSASATDAELIEKADLLDFGNASVIGAEDVANTALSISKGVVTFSGAGPATIGDAITLVNDAVNTDDAAVAFKYRTDTYVYSEGTAASTTDHTLIKLAGVTGVTELGVHNNDLFIV